jgi:hypothetical protein
MYAFRQIGGYCHGSFKDLTEQQIKEISAHPNIKSVGRRLIVGYMGEDGFAKVPAEISYMDENTFAIKRRSNLVVTMFISCFILCFLQLILLGLFHSVKSYETVFILKNILCVSVLMVNLLIILILKNNLNIISKTLMIIHPIFLLFMLYYLPRRIDFLIHFIFLAISIVYVVIYSYKYFKNHESKKLVNGIFVAIYPIIVSIYKSFELENSLFLNDIKVDKFLAVGAIGGMLASTIYCIFKTDRTKKAEFIGGLVGTFFGVMMILWLVPMLTIQNINYTLDCSSGIKCEYQIVDKYTRISTGRYRNTNYYFTIIKDGEKEEIMVEKYVYYSYEPFDTFELYYYEGFLKNSYYEYLER